MNAEQSKKIKNYEMVNKYFIHFKRIEGFEH